MAAAADAMKEVVATVVPLVKRAGFKKRRHTFNRTPERGLVHVINFQMGPFTPPGPGSEAHATGSEALGIIDSDLYGTFTINLGVYAAAMVIDESVQPGTWVNHYNCQLRRRIGQLLTNEDVWWSLDAPDEVGGVVETALTVAALPWLDQFMTTSSIVDAL